ncbi:hypothetical protein H0H81_003679 [Sphagnurus paluster]|uniref:G domain-containing protein n=1 Tax=Sphagnurus paluster TaxID=117069 RepID=A0A9P7FT47_9AGAR|nr:hypothetical protein H0H81_003679 [Sphagnurus paluster]
MAADLRRRVRRFRILVIGRANAGKTTILQKVCNTTDQPEIYNAKGKKVDETVVDPTGGRGLHDINNELVFRSNPGFIFHDSRGFESGAVTELNDVQAFIANRLRQKDLDQQLHAIWYCLPLDNARPISTAEELFFTKCGTGKGIVIGLIKIEC